MKVIIHLDRKVFLTTSKLGNDLENNAEILYFKFPKELQDYSKYLEIQTDDGKFVSQIVDDEFSIANNLTKYSNVSMQVVCKDLSHNVTFKSNIFDLRIDKSINASEDLPEEQPELITQIQEDIYELQQSPAVQDSNYTHTDNNYTNAEKNKLANLENYDDTQIKEDITNLQNNKVDKVAGKGLSTNDYTNEEKAKLETLENYDDTEIKEDISDLADAVEELDINKADKTEIPDVSNFITNTVDNLVNYYKKNETYTQTEVNSLISAISTMNMLVVQTLPTQDISTTTIYLLPRQTAETNNVYDEYIYVSNNWEKIGSTEVDLSNYYTKSQVDALINNIDLSNYYTKTQTDTLLNAKQSTLESGTNIKTINNTSILGSGDITVGGNEIYIGDEEDAPASTKLLIDEDDLSFAQLDSMPVGSVIDFDGESAPYGWQEVEDEGEVYSTEETRVGTWIDGKPIYKKVVQGNLSNNDIVAINVDTLIKFYGSILVSSVYRVIPYYELYNNKNFIATAQKQSNSNDINLQIYSNGTATSGNGQVIIEYTKTTDTVGGAN